MIERIKRNTLILIQIFGYKMLNKELSKIFIHTFKNNQKT